MPFSSVVYTLNNLLLWCNTRKLNPMYAYVIQDRIFSNWIKYVLINGRTGSCVFVCERERERRENIVAQYVESFKAILSTGFK
jgi:hypothetical protein